MTTDRTAIRRRLAVRRTAHRPPLGGRKASPRPASRWSAFGHRSILAPLAATFAATVVVGIGVAVAARAERERRAARQRLPERERRFGLLRSETAANGLRRIALGQLDLAIELLRGESPLAPEEAVHETRKALKRLRALMRLLDGEIGAKRATRERAVLRDAAGALAGARDAEVMVNTLDALMRRRSRELGRRRGLIELREHLRDERRTATAQTLGDSVTRTEVAQELCALRARVAQWQLRDRSADRLLGSGLQRIYRAGRTGHRRAGERRPGPRALHRWRKHVKDLRYALEILDVQDPSGARGRSSGGRRPGKRIAKLAHRADVLGELLGEEHDLMVLAERAGSYRPLKRHRRARKQLLRAISRRRARLRKRALRQGEDLYERRPRRFVRRVRAATRA
ncbi:MAG TPA: CHAD domain-containing protein [Solirubrobacteraceae bacterium]|nr:CHAD domain-containing protein [Solirubrobacteraceae bacterium]